MELIPYRNIEKGIRLTTFPTKPNLLPMFSMQWNPKVRILEVYLACVIFSLPACPLANASLPFWSEYKEWMHSDFLSLSQVCCLHPFSILKTGCSRIDLFSLFYRFFLDGSLLQHRLQLFVTSKDFCADIFGLYETFSWNGSKMKSIFRLDTHSKISLLHVNFF